MFERLLALYRAHRLTEAQLDAAVARGWITREQAAEVIAEPER
jgi:hypothetical protein